MSLFASATFVSLLSTVCLSTTYLVLVSRLSLLSLIAPRPHRSRALARAASLGPWPLLLPGAPVDVDDARMPLLGRVFLARWTMMGRLRPPPRRPGPIELVVPGQRDDSGGRGRGERDPEPAKNAPLCTKQCQKFSIFFKSC